MQNVLRIARATSLLASCLQIRNDVSIALVRLKSLPLNSPHTTRTLPPSQGQAHSWFPPSPVRSNVGSSRSRFLYRFIPAPKASSSDCGEPRFPVLSCFVTNRDTPSQSPDCPARKKRAGGSLEEPAPFCQYTPPCNLHTSVIVPHYGVQGSQKQEESGVNAYTHKSSSTTC